LPGLTGLNGYLADKQLCIWQTVVYLENKMCDRVPLVQQGGNNYPVEKG
jgi:hypothetical protein